MRFFTMAWWCGSQTNESGDPSLEYGLHLAVIRTRLPPDLLATEESVSLHDSRLRELRLLVAENRLSLGLDSHSGDERFTLTYSGVERFESIADPKVGLREPSGYGDLGYCEVEANCRMGFLSTICCFPPPLSWSWRSENFGSRSAEPDRQYLAAIRKGE